MRKYKGLILGWLLLASLPVQGEEEGQEAEESTEAEESSAWSASLSGTYNGGFKEVYEPYSTFSLRLKYNIDEVHSYTLRQSVNRHFQVDPSQREVEPNDTIIQRSADKFLNLMGVDFSSALDLSIPLSRDSRDNEVVTRVGFSLGTGFSVGDSFSMHITPLARYYVNRYKTTKTTQTSGGTPLPWFSYGAGVGFSYVMSTLWTFYFESYYGETRYEQDTGLEEVEGFINADDLPSHPYSLDAGFRYTLYEHYFALIGMGQGSQLESFGGRDFVVFDDAVSYWYAGLGVSF